MSTTSTAKNKTTFRGRFISFTLNNLDKPIKWPDTMILHYSENYLVIQNCPPTHPPKHWSNECNFEKELISFSEYFKEKLTEETIVFSDKNTMKYNLCNGLIAVYSYDRLLVARPDVIWEDTLLCLGYSRDESLPVPFANGEAYYDKFRDELHAIW